MDGTNAAGAESGTPLLRKKRKYMKHAKLKALAHSSLALAVVLLAVCPTLADEAKARTPSAVVVAATPATVARLAKMFGKDARYSASSVQGAGSPLCATHDDYTALPIWNVDSRTLDCVIMNEEIARSKPETFSNAREFDDHHMYSTPEAAMANEPGETFATVQNGKFWAAESSVTGVRLLEAPKCKKGEGLESTFVIRHLDVFCDFATSRFDVLTPSEASAKGVKLADEKKAFIVKALAAAKARGAADEKAEVEELQTVKFPPSTGADPASVKAVKAHLAATKTDIEPRSVKKVALTSSWDVTKSILGLVLYRTADVTVGFARTDVYSIDANSKCAIATFEVKQEYAHGKYSAPVATGAVSKWTNILCDRLK
jgi:hypothetical protein